MKLFIWKIERNETRRYKNSRKHKNSKVDSKNPFSIPFKVYSFKYFSPVWWLLSLKIFLPEEKNGKKVKFGITTFGFNDQNILVPSRTLNRVPTVLNFLRVAFGLINAVNLTAVWIITAKRMLFTNKKVKKMPNYSSPRVTERWMNVLVESCSSLL